MTPSLGSTSENWCMCTGSGFVLEVRLLVVLLLGDQLMGCFWSRFSAPAPAPAPADRRLVFSHLPVRGGTLCVPGDTCESGPPSRSLGSPGVSPPLGLGTWSLCLCHALPGPPQLSFWGGAPGLSTLCPLPPSRCRLPCPHGLSGSLVGTWPHQGWRLTFCLHHALRGCRAAQPTVHGPGIMTAPPRECTAWETRTSDCVSSPHRQPDVSPQTARLHSTGVSPGSSGVTSLTWLKPRCRQGRLPLRGSEGGGAPPGSLPPPSPRCAGHLGAGGAVVLCA